MAGLHWQGNRLLHTGDREGELGYVELDQSSGTYVLWLKDHNGVFLDPGRHVRGDEWNSLDEAKAKAPESTSVRLALLMWMRSAAENRDGESRTVSDNLRAMSDIIAGTVSRELREGDKVSDDLKAVLDLVAGDIPAMEIEDLLTDAEKEAMYIRCTWYGGCYYCQDSHGNWHVVRCVA